jgi:predicted PurR-regulated permease PerM
MIVVASWPALRAAQRRLWGKRSLAVTVMTLAMLVIVVGPVAVAVTSVVDHSDTILEWSKSLTDLSTLRPPEWVQNLPLVGERLTLEWQKIASARAEDLTSHVKPYMKNIALWVLGQVGGIGTLLVQLLLTVVISAILYAQGETVAAAVLAFARRLAGGAGERAAILSAQAIRAVALGIVITALVQSIIGGVGLFVTGVPHAVLLTAIMFLLGVAQIGPIPVLLGSIIWLFWKDATVGGTILIVWSLVTASLDNFLRPILIKKGADLPLLLIFAGVLGGLLGFGIIGLFIGPVVLAVTYTLLQAWVNEGERPERSKSDAQP